MFQLRCLFKGDFHSRAASLFKKYFISINKSMEKYANFQPKNRYPEEKMSNEKNVNVFNNCESLLPFTITDSFVITVILLHETMSNARKRIKYTEWT